MSTATNPCCHFLSFRPAPPNSRFSIRVHLKPLLPRFPLNSSIHCVSTLSRRRRNVSSLSLYIYISTRETGIFGFCYVEKWWILKRGFRFFTGCSVKFVLCVASDKKWCMNIGCLLNFLYFEAFSELLCYMNSSGSSIRFWFFAIEL